MPMVASDLRVFVRAPFGFGGEFGVHGRSRFLRMRDCCLLRAGTIAGKNAFGYLDVLSPNLLSPFSLGESNAHAALEVGPARSDRLADRRIPRQRMDCGMVGHVGLNPFMDTRVRAKRTPGRKRRLEDLNLARAGVAPFDPLSSKPRGQPIEGGANLIQIENLIRPD